MSRPGTGARLALLVLPVAFVAAAGLVMQLRGPFYLATNQDPDYTYLVSALLLAHGEAPIHVDHPGTTVHEAGALGLHAAHAWLGAGSTLAEDTLAHPEMYLRLLAGAMVLAGAAALWWCGHAVLGATASLPAALLAQTGPFFSVTILRELGTWKPEPMLVVLSTLLAGAAARTWDGHAITDAETIVLAAVSALAVATKVTALSLVAIPLVLARSWRGRALAAGAAAATFVLVTLPEWSRAPRFFGFQRQVVVGHGLYGMGELSDTVSYTGRLRVVMAENWPFLVLVAVAGAVAALAWARRDRWTRPAPGPVRTLAALAIAGTLQFGLLLAQPYQPRYLVPALALQGLALAALWRVVVDTWAGGLATLRLAVVAAAIVFAWYQLGNARRLAGELRWAERVQRAAGVAAEHAGCPVVTYYRASSVPEALRMGNYWTYGRFAGTMQRLYPGALFLYAQLPESHDGLVRFENFLGEVPVASVTLFDCVVLQGSPGGPLAPFREPAAFDATRLPVAARVKIIAETPVEYVRMLKRPRSRPRRGSPGA